MKSRAGYFWMLLLLVILLPMPSWAARQVHYFGCNDCHRAGMPLTNLNNLCLKCHNASTGVGTTLNDGTPSALPSRKFLPEDASNTLGSLAAIPGYTYDSGTAKEISHLWGVGDTNPAAGATSPTDPVFAGKNNASRGKIFCARCHNSHNQDTYDRKLLKLDNSADQMCMSCHLSWYENEVDAYLTHPVGPSTDYATVLAADINGRFKSTITNVAQGDVRLVQGYVSCTSCHGMHFTDSDSATTDSYTIQATMDGDGHQLRTDGPTRANKSTLCQACHDYQEHGKMLDGGESVGCLVCHSGHAYNGGVPNFFVLRGTTTTSTYGAKSITYTAATQAWNDNTVVTANGYCEKCHGSAETIPKGAGTHTTTAICRDCHKHKVSGGTYSFQNDANAATCGDCHGFPPYLNVRGDRNTGGTDGGYAYKNATHNYSLLADDMDESKTPHNVHAAGSMPQGVSTDYIFGSGVEACNPCHNGLSELTTHDSATDPGDYRDFAWNNLAKAGTLLSPAYKENTPNQWTCSAVYCHSNGGKRNASGTKVLGDYTTVITPSWLNGSNPRTLIGTGNECNACHGNSSSTMTTRNNSTSHGKHLGGGTLLKTYSCSVCHSQTATSSTALASGARLVNAGGKHVNGVVDVAIDTTANLGSATLGAATYNGGVNGTCQVYCHSNGKGVYPGTTPDWDTASTGACGTCHGTTAATLATGSHARHIDATKGKIKCDACHGAGAQTGTHSGHVDGAITKLTTAASCDSCHGVENSAAWDISPVWGNASSIDCRTCHTGAVLTSYVNTASATVSISAGNRLAKTLASTTGHNLPSGNYPVTNVPAGNKNCTACHTTIGTGHVDGLGNGDLLVGGFSCESCHTTGGARAAEATRKVQSHSNTNPAYTLQKRADFTKVCLACHDPHGTSNGAMLENLQTAQNAKDASGNYAGDVVFSALLTANGFDELDSGAGANNDDICSTCHSTTLHNNRSVTGTHHENENCTTACHSHNGANGGFMPTGGNFCNDCHGNPPTASDNRPAGKGGVHAAHVNVTSNDATEDKFDCDVCHPGASSYTMSHANATVELAAGITNGTCANACHKSTAGDGSWTDVDGLDCTACHYWSATPTSAGNVTGSNSEAVSATHNKHFDSGKVCVTCHPNNGTDTMAPHAHINDNEAWTLNSTNDGSVLTDRGGATQDEATVSVTSWNDGTDNCSNAGCHNPSGLTKSATWGTPNAQGCDFCHSSTNPDAGKGTPGSHGAHMAATTNFGLTVACTSCHPNNTVNGHLTGAVNLNGGLAYSTSLTDYTSSTFGQCTTTTCHNNGRGTAVQTPVWGIASANCTICHNNGAGQPYPTVGRHAPHVANAAYVTSSCGSCHPNSSPTQITAATHINGTRNVTGASITSFTTPTCVNNCHVVDATGTWTDANTLDCLECHTTGKSAGGALPSSGLHAGTLTVSGNTHDNSFKVTKAEGSPSGTCLTCHTSTPSSAHKTGTVSAAEATVVAAVGYTGGATPTCGPNGALVNCHDDKGAWKRRWSITAKNSDGTQCGNCHGNFDTTWTTGVGQRHSSDAQLHGSHNGVDDCYTCHTYKAGDTTYYNLATQHRDGTIQLNNQMSFTDDGATVHCTGCHTVPLGLADGQYSFQDTYNGDGADGGLNRWGRAIQAGPSANCNSCHVTNGLTHADANESATVHTYHTGSPLTPGCGACHPADSGPGGANHQNGTIDFGGTYLTTALNYPIGGFTNTNCSTANGCHNSDANSWASDSLATCGDCHAATGKVLYTGSGLSGYPPTSNEHAIHIANNAYVGATASTDCDDCHGAGSSAPDHLAAHNDGFKTMASKVTSYTVGDGTCVNSCHGTADGRDWTSNTTLTCTDCHTGTFIGKVNKNHTSGLHQATVATAHDDSFGAGGTCTSCHTGINLTTPVTHVNGSAADANTTYGLFANYSTGGGTCYNSCHADGGDWARKWIGVVDAKPQYADAATAAVCGNCHGSFAQGWRFVNEANASTTDHTDPDVDNVGDQMNTAGHQVCSKCHGWGVTAYQTGTMHQNSNLTMNSDLGYTDGTGTCTTNCHHGLTLSLKTNSGFTTQTAAFGGLGCGACHDDGALPPNSGAHAAHGADADADYTECEACHGTNNGGSWATGSGGTHNTGTVNFAAGITYSNNATPGTNAAAADDTCNTTQCHSPAGNTATWGTPASIACIECHYYEASPTGANNTANANALSPTHNKHFNKGKVCTDCHGTLPTDRTHITDVSGANDGLVLTGKANALQDEANITRSGTTWDDGNNTCTGTTLGLGCHASGTPDWDTPITTCVICHTNETDSTFNPTSGLHNFSAATRHDDTLQTGNCVNCHDATTPSSLHQNGTKNTSTTATFNFNATKVLSYSSSAGCAANCHRDGGNWKRKWTGAADAAATGSPGQAVCNNCHGQYSTLTNSTGWNEGTVHFRSGSGAAENKGDGHTDASPNQCQDCHGYPVAGTHNSNAKVDFSGGGVSYTLTWGTNGTQPGWYCASCHAQASDDATVTSSHTFLDSLAFPSPTRATPENIVYVVGTTTPSGSCTSCHGNSVSGGFWPDSSNANTMNVAGAHPQHVQAIASKMAGGDTTSNRNSTCIYCHPGNTHGGADGVEPADVSNTDSDNNGTADVETSTKFKRIVSPFATDTTGFWRRTPGTCSTVACHASAPFTPHWYADNVVPGTIGDLAAVANTEPGTVKLTWTTPGDDGSLDGTIYRYDVRFSTSLITEGNFASASQAKAPSGHRKGVPESIIVKGLIPGTTYYFAVKSYDEVGNVSAISNVPNRAAQIDNVAPVFWGISAVSANDYSLDMTPNPDTNSVNVSWDAGRDHSHSLSTPLNYIVLWSEYSLRTHFSSGGPMPATIGTDVCFDKTDVPLLPVTCGSTVPLSNEYRIKSAQTTALNYDVKNLPVGTVYNFLVRAKDASGNVDSNRAELMAMAKTTDFQTIALQTQLTSAAIPASSTGWTGLPGGTTACDAALGASYPGTAPGTYTTVQNVPVVWSPTSTYSIKTNVWGLSYQLKITGSSNGAATLSYQFGYLTGKAFTSFGTAKTLTLPRRAPARVIKFPLTTFKGAIPAGSEPAFVVVNTSVNQVVFTYGSTANKGGILLFNQQDYNDLPTGLGSLTQTPTSSTFIGGNLYRLTWTAASAVNGGQSVHYDVFGSLDGGTTYPYTIGRNLTSPTVDWDPVGDGITGNQTNVRFKVLAGDGYRSGTMLVDGTNANNANHSEVASGTFTVNNTVDVWTPAAIGSAVGTADDLKVETRPKQGSVALTWKAVGNDGFNHGTRATQYDIRFSTSPIPDNATFDALPAQNQATNEPYPDFTGAMESYELLGLNPDAPYYFAMKVGDAAGNWSPLSNVATTQSGPKCGICHSTPPDEPATAGNHTAHGYTMADCANCHGTEAASFTTDHQDGQLKLGWKTATPVVGVVNDSAGTVTYTQVATVIYSDTNGVGGFNQTSGGTPVDNGTCSGFNGTNTSGCHGPATPAWDAAASLACSACHGLGSRTTDTYGRNFDATLDNAMVVPDQVISAPPLDNHGGATGKYVGAHLKHLNSSFRLAKGDNCMLCHKENVHADGTVDVAYDLNVTGAGALWTPGSGSTPGTCAGTNVDNCHGTNTPSWDSAATVACNSCHGFDGKSFPVGSAPTINGGAGVIAHVSDGNVVRACTWCHPAGHPQGTVQEPNAIMIPNNPLIGVAYRSGGIHLLKTINGRGPFTTEAQICWACHDAQGTKITEWAANNDASTGSSPYNYGDLFTDINFTTATSNWLGGGTGAYWRSGTSQFQTIKKGKIQSTHSTNTGGTGTVAWDVTNLRYNETLDAVADIRCSNCHDVHNMNKAPNDAVIGTPYLRGTWMGNPYNEDGPPLSGTTYLDVPIGSYGFGAVPRAGTGYRQLGGYFIDQNNVVPGTASLTSNAAIDDYPTAGWTQESSAGLCILCHGNDVDNMDQKAGENLWLGTNGHSNSAIGGTFTNSVNIFDNGVGTSSLSGRPVPVVTTSVNKTTQVPDMAYQMQPASGSTTRGYGYRGTTGTTNSGGYTPKTGTLYAHYAYDWGASVDASSIDQMYHQFSCSKCHNPHASRLPKLLITNCLDIQHNAWDNTMSVQSAYTAATLTDVDRFGGTGERPAYYASAQNCHRYNNKRTAANKGGWNKVSPWTTANQ